MNKLFSTSVFIITILAGITPEKYQFRINTNAIQTHDHDSFSDFQIDGESYIGTSSTREIHTFEPLIENKNYQYKHVRKIISNISTSRRNDKSRPDHHAQKLAGCIFSSYIDSAGYSDFVEGNNDIANEMIEAAEDNSGIMMIDDEKNYLYPFSDTLRSVGESWYLRTEKQETEDKTTGMGDFAGTSSIVKKFTFKKIKEKKGDLIAYVDIECTFESQGITRNWDDEYEMFFSGNFTREIRFNITKGVFVRSKGKTSFKGKGRDLKTDKTNLFLLSSDDKIKFKHKFN